jgi:hypothetical protein
MSDSDLKWSLIGDCVEACTSPTVCPYYFGSSAPTALHDGKDQCEGAFTFRIRQGNSGRIDLSSLMAGYGFNTGVGGPGSGDPWKTILFIDDTANESQFVALEEIFRTCWALAGKVLKVKRATFRFQREKVGSNNNAGYKHTIQWNDVYSLKTEPLLARDGSARYISGQTNGIIYIGRSVENIFNDSDLPRGTWDSPGMSNTYFEFAINPLELDWVP